MRLVVLGGLLAVMLLPAFAVTLRAQSTAMLKGRVVDATGGAIAGAVVFASDVATEQQRTTHTDGTGAYLLAALPAGVYRVEARASGFATSVVEKLSVDVARGLVQDFVLGVGGVQQEVIVRADRAGIERSTIAVGQLVDRGIVQQVPLNRRQFIELGLLVPGSVTPSQNPFLSAPTRGQGSQAMFTAGNREDTTRFPTGDSGWSRQVQLAARLEF